MGSFAAEALRASFNCFCSLGRLAWKPYWLRWASSQMTTMLVRIHPLPTRQRAAVCGLNLRREAGREVSVVSC